MTKQELIDYFEHIRLQLVAFRGDKIVGIPSSVGSAFLLDYRNHTFLVTADHVVNTHDKGVRRLDKTVAIQTNRYRVNNNKPECELVGLTEIEFFTHFNVNLSTGDIAEMPLFDAAYRVFDADMLSKYFVTSDINFEGVSVNPGEPKQHLPEQCIAMPTADKEYCVFGRIRFELKQLGGINILKNELTFKEGLKYIGYRNDYYILQSPKDFVYEDWAGLSGSAVLDTDGNLIGIACSVIATKRLIYVKKIQALLPLMQASILQIDHPEIMTPPSGNSLNP